MQAIRDRFGAEEVEEAKRVERATFEDARRRGLIKPILMESRHDRIQTHRRRTPPERSQRRSFAQAFLNVRRQKFKRTTASKESSAN